MGLRNRELATALNGRMQSASFDLEAEPRSLGYYHENSSNHNRRERTRFRNQQEKNALDEVM
jgi:hypothetical protein